MPPARRAVAAGTRIGHVHLQISELEAAERFYCGVLGFEATARDATRARCSSPRVATTTTSG